MSFAKPKATVQPDPNDMEEVGFIGIGKMGWRMAARLVRSGVKIQVYDINPAHGDRFATEVGGQASRSLPELAQSCSTIITMLPDSAIVEATLFSEGGVASHAGAGTLVIDMTSGVPDQTIRFAERLKEKGLELIDAPVSGGVARAETGELAIMVGGDSALIERSRAILETMGTLLPTGKVGSGHAMKALNNLVSAAGFLIGVEALLIGSQFGLDPRTMVDILNVSTGANNSTQKKFRQFVLSRSYGSGFGMDLMVKDLSIAIELGRSVGTATPFAALCREMWASAQAMLDDSNADHTEMARASEMLAGTRLPGIQE